MVAQAVPGPYPAPTVRGPGAAMEGPWRLESEGVVMAGKRGGKKRKKKRRILGRTKGVPSASHSGVKAALANVRKAKAKIQPGTHRGGFALLHRIESELTRLG